MTNSTNMTFSKLRNTTADGMKTLFNEQDQDTSKQMVLNATDQYGNTVLHVFVELEEQARVDVLMNYSFSVALLSARNNQGDIPLHIAGYSENSNITNALLKPLFKENGTASLSSVLMVGDAYGKSPLHFIAQSPQLFNSSLAQAKAYNMTQPILSLEDEHGDTAMHFILQEENHKALKDFFNVAYYNATLQSNVLLKKNANGDIPVMFTVDHTDTTMFGEIASWSRNEHLVQMLDSKSGADGKGRNLLRSARSQKNQPLVNAINELIRPKIDDIYGFTYEDQNTSLHLDYRITSIYPVSSLNISFSSSNISLVWNSTNEGTLRINGTTVEFMPAQDFDGVVKLPLTVSYDTQKTTVNLTIYMRPVNDAPIAEDFAINVSPKDLSTVFVVGIRDVDNATSTLTVTGTANKGTIAFKNCTDFANNTLGDGLCGNYTLTTTSFVGKDNVNYTVFDGSSLVTGHGVVTIASACVSSIANDKLVEGISKVYLYNNTAIPCARVLFAAVNGTAD